MSFLVGWCCAAGCASMALAPPLLSENAVRVTVHEDQAQGALQFTLTSSSAIARAQLLYGVEGGRAPIAVMVSCAPAALPTSVAADDNAQCTAQQRVAVAGLRLPRDVSQLRYAWQVQAADGRALTVTRTTTTTLIAPERSVPELVWQETRLGQVSLFALPNTPAARDIAMLQRAATSAFARVERALDDRFTQRVSIYLIPRIFWNGGAAFGGGQLFVSYADRPYPGVSAEDYFAHEGAHALTQDWGNLGQAGGILSEGVAVYATGGHYDPDVLDQSAAAMVQSDLFIPLSVLRRDFSNQQHEIAYTQSASFVKFLIERGGLEKFRQLMRRPGDWRNLYGAEFEALAQEWATMLRARATPADEVQRWRLKIRYYDVMRRYEERFDPDARRLPAVPVSRWEPDLRRAYAAPAEGTLNRIFELALVMTVDAMEHRQFAKAERLLGEVERALECHARVSECDAQIAGLQTMSEIMTIVQWVEQQSQAIADRDLSSLQASVGSSALAQTLSAQLQAQPAWLRYGQAPVRLELRAQQAWLTVARWHEPLDLSQPNLHNGQRWVLALQKGEQGWRMIGQWPEATDEAVRPVVMGAPNIGYSLLK